MKKKIGMQQPYIQPNSSFRQQQIGNMERKNHNDNKGGTVGYVGTYGSEKKNVPVVFYEKVKELLYIEVLKDIYGMLK